MLDSIRFEAEGVRRRGKEEPLAEIPFCSKSVIKVPDWKVENVFRHIFLYIRQVHSSFSTNLKEKLRVDETLRF